MTTADELRTLVTGAASTAHALETWCDARGIGSGQLWVDVRTRADVGAMPHGAAIGLRPGELVFYRTVLLMRGRVPILDAKTWFLPIRLSSGAVQALIATDRPFAMALGPGRIAQRIWQLHVPRGAARALPYAPVVPLEVDDVPLLTQRATLTFEGVKVAVVEERLRTTLLGGQPSVGADSSAGASSAAGASGALAGVVSAPDIHSPERSMPDA